MRTSSAIAVNAFSSWVATGLQAVVGLLVVRFLLFELGKEGYGLVALVGVVVGLTALADLGIRGALGRHLAEQVAKKDPKKFNELVSSAMAFYLGVGAIVAVLCMFIAPWAARVFNVGPAWHAQAVALVRWYASFAAVLALMTPVFSAAIISNNRFDLLNYVMAGTGIVRGLALFAVLGLTGTGVFGWAGVTLACSLLSLAVLYSVAHRLNPEMRIRPSCVRRSAIRSLFSLGAYMFAFQLTGLLSVRSDPIVLASFLGPAAVAIYMPALSLAGLARPIVQTVVNQLHPLTTRYHVTGQSEQLKAALIRGTKYTVLMAIPVCVVLGVFCKAIMHVWLGEGLGDDCVIAAYVLLGWMVVDLFNYAAGAQGAVMLGMNRLKVLVWTQLPLAVVNVLASIVLVGYTPLGIVGVVLPTVVIGMFRRPFIAVYVARTCGVSAREYFRESYLMPIVVLVLITTVSLLLWWAVRPATLWSLGMCALLVGLIWSVACYKMGFNDADRESFRQLWRRMLQRVARGAGESAR